MHERPLQVRDGRLSVLRNTLSCPILTWPSPNDNDTHRSHRQTPSAKTNCTLFKRGFLLLRLSWRMKMMSITIDPWQWAGFRNTNTRAKRRVGVGVWSTWNATLRGINNIRDSPKCFCVHTRSLASCVMTNERMTQERWEAERRVHLITHTHANSKTKRCKISK